MRPAILLLIALILTLSTFDSFATCKTPSVQNQTDAPIRIGPVTKRLGKPPLVLYSCDVEFINHRNEAVWLVMRYWGEQPLDNSDVLSNVGPWKQPFDATRYLSNPRNKGQTVIVNYLSDNGFKAIRLPKGGSVKFDEYGFEAWKPVTDFEIWEVRALFVNGRTRLERWLPFATMSDLDVHVVKEDSYDNMISLNWDERINDDRRDFPKQRVRFVRMQVLKKWILPLNIKAAT